MSVIAILIAISLGLALLFLACFVWAVRSGQYEDTLTPSMRILADEDATKKTEPKIKSRNFSGRDVSLKRRARAQEDRKSEQAELPPVTPTLSTAGHFRRNVST